MTAAEREQAVLDEYSHALATLDPGQRMIAVTNAFVFSTDAPATVVSGLAQTMVSLAFHIDDAEIKMRVCSALRSAADRFEESIVRKVIN